jgi:hypothetical protein
MDFRQRIAAIKVNMIMNDLPWVTDSNPTLSAIYKCCIFIALSLFLTEPTWPLTII